MMMAVLLVTIPSEPVSHYEIRVWINNWRSIFSWNLPFYTRLIHLLVPTIFSLSFLSISASSSGVGPKIKGKESTLSYHLNRNYR